MNRTPVVFLAASGLLALACSAGPVRTTQPPEVALRGAEARFVERGISLDAAGRTPTRLRTERYCYVPPDAQGNSWDRSFTSPFRGALTRTVEGDDAEQTAERSKCAWLFRVELQARELPEGHGELQATSEWWHVAQRHCEPVGHPLMGRMTCTYGYDGALAPQSVEPFVHALLTGL